MMTTEEAISRQAVMNIISFEYGWLIDAKEYNTNIRIAFNSLMSKVKALPSVTPKAEQKWIPCTERLPEEVGLYLVSMHRLGYPQRGIDGFVSGKWERYGNNVIAWMPMPEAYTESEVAE